MKKHTIFLIAKHALDVQLLYFVFLSICAQALQIEQVTFPDHAMFGQTITMICEYTIGQSEYVDSIKWYKDNLEFYRIVPNTPIERDRVVTFPRPGIKLDKEKSGVRILTNNYQMTCKTIFKIDILIKNSKNVRERFKFKKLG
jgi:hypothetical protein